MAEGGRWIEVAGGVFARRYRELDQTLGLVVGRTGCVVVDTGTDETHGAEFAAAIREVTELPWTVVITHAHFDHFFGTAAFSPCAVWAHERCAVALADSDGDRRTWMRRYREQGRPELADRLGDARLVMPTDLFTDRVRLDLGGRVVDLIHPGPAHTDHDVMVHVPDAAVVFAGDLVEQGAAPSVGSDAHVDRWPAALDLLLALRPETVVPGHGEPVGPGFVLAQRDELQKPKSPKPPMSPPPKSPPPP
ncbi:MBL fold metallo-hydrolase [Actinophytocola xinjiangensis]|uniref:MBL fold metallo-hydrolase n=1 Tax=Actinophytocola xinjiangensis TaxID=485602 RepID=A0A7Z0WKD6_9PSEU|nr:MBL fold metallo-hydrolase [Actinophytocola xinjiangensis]OLF08837.1 MBL fold metallo-hydrolase [Actinophytocola xinjiangensis]